jgi:hypothetical protein
MVEKGNAKACKILDGNLQRKGILDVEWRIIPRSILEKIWCEGAVCSELVRNRFR